MLLVALLEFNRMGLGHSCRIEQWLAAVFGAGVIPLLLNAGAVALMPFYTFVFLLLAILFLFRFESLEQVHRQFGWLLFGLLYLPLLLGHLMPLRLLDHGRRWIFLTLLVIMACDTFAYFIGSAIGRRKLYPAVSPNKSLEGALGGLAGAVSGVFAAKLCFAPFVGWLDGLAVGLLLGTLGQLGDLFESLLKRACGVKDSGSIIPGHGGLLDRLDSLLFAFPVVYYLARYGYGG